MPTSPGGITTEPSKNVSSPSISWTRSRAP